MGDLSPIAQNRLKSLNFIIIPVICRFNNPSLDRFVTLASYCRENPGHYAYWEADVYFQTNVDRVFEIDKLICCSDYDDFGKKEQFNTGFISASSSLWDIFGTFLTFAAEFGNHSDNSILDYFMRCFPKITAIMEDKWNYVSLTNLRWDNGFYLPNGELVNVIHPGRMLKHTIDGRQYMFFNKYKNIHDDWYAWLIKGNNISARNLLKKTYRLKKT